MSVINKIKIGTDERNIGVAWKDISGKPNYAGSSTAGGPAQEFTAELANGNTDRYIYFAWDATDYNNSNASSIAKGKAVIDTEFKYNPSTNKLSTGSVQLNSKVTLQYNTSTESLDFVFA